MSGLFNASHALRIAGCLAALACGPARAEPMDFIWGIVNAHCVADASDPDAKAKGQCASYEDVVLDRSAGAGE